MMSVSLAAATVSTARWNSWASMLLAASCTVCAAKPITFVSTSPGASSGATLS